MGICALSGVCWPGGARRRNLFPRGTDRLIPQGQGATCAPEFEGLPSRGGVGRGRGWVPLLSYKAGGNPRFQSGLSGA